MMSWVILAGAIVASAVGSERAGVRSLAMLACLGLCLLGPAVASVGATTGVDASTLIGLSPLMAVHTLGEGGGAQPLADQWRWITFLAFGTCAVWIVLLLSSLFIPARAEQLES